MAGVCATAAPGDSSDNGHGIPHVELSPTLADLMKQENLDNMAASAAGPAIQSHWKKLHESRPGVEYAQPAFVGFDDYSEEDLPVVDLSLLVVGDDAATAKVVDAVASSCRDWGFFQVINHGVRKKLIKEARLQARRLFNLPLRQKCKAQSVGGDSGYTSSVLPQQSGLPWSEGFVIHLRPDPQEKNLADRLGLHDSEHFCDVIRNFNEAMHRLGMGILDLIIRGLPGDNIRAHFDEASGNGNHKEMMRMVLYPTCPNPELTQGLGSHTDPNYLTILHQGNIGGLQIFRDGRWMAIRPVHNAFCVNVGDMMQVITNGRYKSVVHRCVVNRLHESVSIAFMMSPWADEVEVKPAPGLDKIGRERAQQPIRWGQYRQAARMKRPSVDFDVPASVRPLTTASDWHKAQADGNRPPYEANSASSNSQHSQTSSDYRAAV